MAKAVRRSAKTPRSAQSGNRRGVDLNAVNRDELLQLQKDVEAALRSYKKRRHDDALREMQMVAERHGLALKDVMKGGSKTSALPPKYRHPENPALTWSGRGRQPAWFKEAIAAGTSRDDLLIA